VRTVCTKGCIGDLFLRSFIPQNSAINCNTENIAIGWVYTKMYLGLGGMALDGNALNLGKS
jgi:hypothetical protein